MVLGSLENCNMNLVGNKMKVKRNRYRIAPIIATSILFLSFFNNCSENTWYEQFGVEKVITPDLNKLAIPNKILSNPEMMSANDSVLVLHDYFNKKLFTSLDLQDTTHYQRFGFIGHGANEINVGTTGYLSDNKYVIYDPITKIVGKYTIFSGDSSFVKLDIKIPETVKISRTALVTDSTIFNMGCYSDAFKYSITNREGEALDSLGEIAGKNDANLNTYHKFLAEQGNISISPDKKRIAAITSYSDNIDFMNISPEGLKMIMENHHRDAAFTPMTLGKDMYKMMPDIKAPIGFIGITSNNKYVFALYAKHSLEEGGYDSPFILCYDWAGNPIALVDLKEPALAIAANSTKIYALMIDENGLCCIKYFDIDKYL